MTHKLTPTFLPLVLIICLVIGGFGNLTNTNGLSIVICASLLGLGVWFSAARLDRVAVRTVRLGLGGLLAMLIGQIGVLGLMPDTVYHDPYRILAQADQMAAGHLTWQITYFWRYANNVPLTYLLSLWLRLTRVIGLSTNLALHLLSLMVLDGFIILALLTIWQLSHRPSLVVAAFGFFALTPFAYTYYLQVFYSDLPTMLILLIIMRTLLNWAQASRRQHLLRGAGLVLAALVGMLIKANLIVLLPALVIVLLMIARRRLLHRSQLLLPVVLLSLGCALSMPATKLIDQASHYRVETKFAFPASNWLLMGYNAASHGRYSGRDVRRSIALPTEAARQRADLQALPKRIAHLGLGGVLRLWVRKLQILLKVGGIQDWYNGGFRSAPSWYLHHVRFLRRLTILSYTAATIALWVTLALRLAVWRPELSDPKQVVALLAVVTSLGYLAFHTLLWEVEPRYGQALLPLIWIALAALPDAQRERRANHRWVGGVVCLVASLLAAIGLAGTLSKPAENQVVAAQRSQLSVQYHAKPEALGPGTILTEDVALHAAANYFSVQIHAASTVQVTLTNTHTDRQYRLVDAGSVYRLHHRLAPGRYRITVRNLTAKKQQVDVVHTARYQLGEYPLVIDGHRESTASLVFTCMQRVIKKG